MGLVIRSMIFNDVFIPFLPYPQFWFILGFPPLISITSSRVFKTLAYYHSFTMTLSRTSLLYITLSLLHAFLLIYASHGHMRFVLVCIGQYKRCTYGIEQR